MKSKAIFIDKDGTLVKDIPYNVDPTRIFFEEGVKEALSILSAEGFKLIMISNQSGVARGYFQEYDLEPVKEKIQEELLEVQVQFDAFYFCPHHPCGIVDKYTLECECRKPLPGMILQAAKDFNIDLFQSWMIGDILHDVEAGNRADCRTILINNGNETEWKSGPFRVPSFIAQNFLDAAHIIKSMKTYSVDYESRIPQIH